jgi:plastocyanin
MSRVFIINKKQLMLLVSVVIVIILSISFLKTEKALPANVGMTSEERTIHMVTGEFKTTTKEGKEIEAYRWDPGTVFVEKGEQIKLSIYGVNGESHPFIIEGLNIKGEVKKGEETIITFDADKEGIYRIICLTHPDKENEGPMIGYIVVD